MEEKVQNDVKEQETPMAENEFQETAPETAATEEPEMAENASESKDEKGGFLKKNKHAKKMEALTLAKEKAEAEKAEIHDKYIRLYSEFDNYRRRTQREKLDIIKNAAEDIIVGILPVLDDMERALKYEGNADDKAVTDSEKEGILLIYNKLKNFLKNQGLEEIVSIGEPFNVDLDEAVTTMPAAKEEDKGRILDEIQKGYKLNDKVIRFAKVVIFQ